MEKRQLTVRGMVIGIAGLLVITASSMYVALRMGALPWPTVFVTIVSLAALKHMKGSTTKEMCVTYTLMSAGAMVAGGLAFTIPGIWMLNPQAHVPTSSLLVLAICGSLLGTCFTSVFRKEFIVEEQLPYPMGQASYNTLMAGMEGGKGARTLFISMGGSAVFTVLRDGFAKIPTLLTFFKGSAIVPAVSIWVSPMALGIGAIIGPLLSLVWLGGAIFAYYMMTPVGISMGWFSDMAAADLFRTNLGLGLMVGTGFGVFFKAVWKKGKQFKQRKETPQGRRNISTKKTLIILGVALACCIALALWTEISFLQALVVMVGIYLTTYLAGMLTGQTGVNPMEVFGILVLLVIQVLWNPSLIAAFSVAGITAVACGLTGDVMNDFKSGYMIGTDPKAQLVAEGIGGVLGAVVAVIVLLVMKQSFGGFGTAALPAPQAAAVSAMAGGLGHVPAFLIGAIIGVALYLFNVPAATLGLGIYLPVYISSIMGMGAISMLIVRACTRKVPQEKVTHTTNLVASGLLGGEGVTGVIIAIISMF